MRLAPRGSCCLQARCLCALAGLGPHSHGGHCLPSYNSPPHRARMSAAQCLAHPWLNNLAEKAKRCNRRLKSQILLKKYLMKRRWKVPGLGERRGAARVRDRKGGGT